MGVEVVGSSALVMVGQYPRPLPRASTRESRIINDRVRACTVLRDGGRGLRAAVASRKVAELSNYVCASRLPQASRM